MKEFNRKILANNIKELRKQKRLNQVELAKQLNVSQQTVGAWETGRAIPGSDTLDILADFFDVSTDYLLKDNNEKESNSSTKKHHFNFSLSQFNPDIWTIAVAIYIICGFAFNNWDSSLIVFPIALILDSLN